MKALIRYRLRALGRFVVAGALVGMAVGAVIQQIDGGELGPHLARGTLAGVLIGALVGIGEELVLVGRRVWRSYWGITALRVVGYSAVVLGSLVLVNGAWASWTTDATLAEAADAWLHGETSGRDLVFAIGVAVLGTWFLEVRRLHNPGEVVGFLVGRYRFPVEERRVFLFVDLAGSTALAERLGPRQYSRFLGDCYRDMAEAILTWRGEVYQHVGDEVVVSWPFERGVARAACVECFLAVRALLASHGDRYRALYGCEPRFRGAIHGGEVMTTWVGLAKTELAFHGDALNVAARLQALASRRDAELLVSGPVLERLRLPAGVTARPLGPVELRGKGEPLPVHEVTPG